MSLSVYFFVLILIIISNQNALYYNYWNGKWPFNSTKKINCRLLFTLTFPTLARSHQLPQCISMFFYVSTLLIEPCGGKKTETWSDVQAQHFNGATQSTGARLRLNMQNSAISLLRTDMPHFSPLSAQTLPEICPLMTLTDFCVHSQLWQQPARCCLLAATSYMCYRCSLVQGVPERVPGPAGVSERVGEGVKRLLSDFRCTVISL